MEYDTEDRRARLDLTYVDPHWGRTWVDVTLCAASAHQGVNVSQRLERQERDKHEKYQGGRLVPFVLDPRGGWGRQARHWFQHVLNQVPEDVRGEARKDALWSVARALQLAVGEQILSSGRPGPPARKKKKGKGTEGRKVQRQLEASARKARPT